MFNKKQTKLSSVKHENLVVSRMNVLSEDGNPKSLTDLLQTQEYCVSKLSSLLRRFEPSHRAQLIGVITGLSSGQLAKVWYLGSTAKCRVMMHGEDGDKLLFCVNDYDTCALLVIILHYLGTIGYEGYQIVSAVLSREQAMQERRRNG